jgi:hypothetical protein
MRISTRSILGAALALIGVASGGCSSCAEGPAVPFGLDAGGAAAPTPEEGDDGHAPARPVGRAFPEGTLRVDVEGAPLASDGSVRALWAHDIDGDGDRDAIAIVGGPPDAPVRVIHARREGTAFAASRVLGHAPSAPEGCAIEQASIVPLGESWLVARASLGCEAHPAAAREEIWVLTTDRTPRALEHLAILASTDRAPGEVALELSTEDHDEDGHVDLVVSARVTRGGEPAVVELPWLDRPSGLARDANQPEATLNERSRDALRLLRGNVAGALAGSRAVLALHEVLCRERGRARVRVGQTEGLGCGTSEGAGRAATTVVRALASRGELLPALDALAVMDEPGLAIDDERRDFARRAIADARAPGGVTLREGPAHAAAWGTTRGQVVHTSVLGFLDEDHVLLRGPRPRSWNVVTGEEQALAPSQGELRVLDPSGELALAGVERRCEGYVLRILSASGIVGGSALGPTHSTALLAPRDPPAGAPCPDLTPALRADDGGFQILGWAPQGVVAARGATLRVVPLDLSGQAAGDPEELAPRTPPPAPLAAGASSSDGRFFVEVRGLGILVHRVLPDAETTLLWPEGWASRDGEVSDAAVSPSGRRVAVLRGGRVLLLERR